MNKLIFPLELETPRLLLRQFTNNDVQDFYRIYGDPEGMKFMGKGARSREETEKSIARKQNQWAEQGYGLWCVVERSTGRTIGHAGIGWLHFLQEYEAAYLIDRDCWGKGYAPEAINASITMAFERLPAKYIISIFRPENIASERVAIKCGMSYWKDVSDSGYEYKCYRIMRPTK